MPILPLALKSLLNRRFSALLTLLSIALSVTLLVGVERIRMEAYNSFTNTVSGTDLIIGARSGQVQLLLYSVFHIGTPTNNLSWESYQALAADRRVAWTIPISLGDSHQGYPVIGTNQDYFRHFRFGDKRQLELAEGRPFDGVHEAVLGAEVAAKLGYQMDDAIIVAHGAGKVSFTQHDNQPFKVVGILRRTGTPVDHTVHIPLEGIEAIHLGWIGGRPMPGRQITAEQALNKDLTPNNITAAFVGLESKLGVFHFQRKVNGYRQEPLTAILPGVALQELWRLIGMVEKALLTISGFVVVVGIVGLLTALLTGIDGRRREMAILRSVGARPYQIAALIIGEAGFLTLLGALLGMALLYILLLAGQPLAEAWLGLYLPVSAPTLMELALLGGVVLAGLLAGIIPAWRAYRNSLADGMSIRL